jgi:SAM-dependent methyltransferase
MTPAPTMAKPTIPYIVEDLRRMSKAKNYLAWQRKLVLQEIVGKKRVVETGCGIGNMTGALLDRELVIALDIEAQCVEELRRRYVGQPNLKTLVSEPGAPGFSSLAGYDPDACVCINVLEHIEDDVRALGAMHAILVRGGRAVLMVPALPMLSGPIDRKLGHYRRYTRPGLKRAAEESGWVVKKLHFMNAAGAAGWWLNARILRLEAQSERQIGVFDRYVVPWTSALERVVKAPFGQSLFAVLEKE